MPDIVERYPDGSLKWGPIWLPPAASGHPRVRELEWAIAKGEAVIEDVAPEVVPAPAPSNEQVLASLLAMVAQGEQLTDGELQVLRDIAAGGTPGAPGKR